MEKNVIISILYGYYYKLLTKKQAEAIELYYEEDLSLTEIAEIFGVSKQNVSVMLKRSENALISFEDKLGFIKKSNQLQKLVDTLEKKLMDDLDDEKYSKYIDILFEIKKLAK